MDCCKDCLSRHSISYHKDRTVLWPYVYNGNPGKIFIGIPTMDIRWTYEFLSIRYGSLKQYGYWGSHPDTHRPADHPPLLHNTFRPRQDGRHFPDNIFKCISLNENVWISLKVSLKVQINNIPALFQIMAWRRLGAKPLSEPMLGSLLMHINASLSLNELTLSYLWHVCMTNDCMHPSISPSLPAWITTLGNFCTTLSKYWEFTVSRSRKGFLYS